MANTKKEAPAQPGPSLNPTHTVSAKDYHSSMAIQPQDRKTIKVEDLYFNCKRCKHHWMRRDLTKEPRVCPKCKTPYWQTERKPKKEKHVPIPMALRKKPGPKPKDGAK